MDDLKTSADTAVSRLLTRAFYTLLPASCAHRLAQRSLLLPSTVLLANLAGPEAPVQLGGCQVRAMFTLMPPPASAHASISVITYGDTVNVCVVSRAAGGGRPARRLLTELRRQLRTMYRLLRHRRCSRDGGRATLSPNSSPAPARSTHELQERLSGVQSQLQALRATSTADDSQQELCEDRQHAGRLQREFAELLTELQRRRSPLGGGAVVTCEAEAAEVELRRPKKLTVVSRQSSTSSASSQSRPLPFGDAEDLRSMGSMTSVSSDASVRGSPLARQPAAPGHGPVRSVAQTHGSVAQTHGNVSQAHGPARNVSLAHGPARNVSQAHGPARKVSLAHGPARSAAHSVSQFSPPVQQRS